jgi:HYDIN/CFA65/VesB family protein
MKQLIRIILALPLTLTSALLLKSDFSLMTALAQQPASSSPKDTTPYSRAPVLEDYSPLGAGAYSSGVAGASEPGIFAVDVIVNNTNPNLTNTDTSNDSELSIAVNPATPNQIVIHSGFGGWNTAGTGVAYVYESTDGGITWTQRSIIPSPPGAAGIAGATFSCPCDTTIDYGRNNLLSGTFLTFPPNANVYSATTNTNPTATTNFAYFLNGGNAVATNANGANNTDQPWLMVNRDPTTAAQDNVYVAYDNFVANPSAMQVAVALGTNPPNFTRDNSPGNSTGGFVNPGHRLAVDSITGNVYSLWQNRLGAGDDGTHQIQYMLNRTTNGGQTWTLNGQAGGVEVARADSTQACPVGNANQGCGTTTTACTDTSFKFGTANALLGGVLHAATDPVTGDLYYVYGNRDPNTNNNRLAIRRLQNNGTGGLTIGAESFVTGQVQAALPAVAVAGNGTVGVFYYTFDGISSSNFPIYTAHLALSDDHGTTFSDQVILTFLSSAANDNTCRQRVLGDYMQMKAVNGCFYGAFTGNGVPFGRTVANHDPIFFKTCVGPDVRVQGTLEFGLVAVNPVGGEPGTKDLEFEVLNVGNENLIVQSVTCASGNCSDFSVLPNPTTPVTVSPNSQVSFLVRFDPTAAGARSATIRVTTDDPDQPIINIVANGIGAVPDIRVTGNTGFGNVCAGTNPTQTVSVCNVGNSNLNVTAAFNPSCNDFTLVNNPFPAIVSHDSCVDLTVRFTPTSAGAKSCSLVITSNDPDSPSVPQTVAANTPVAAIDVPLNQSFLPEVIQTAGVCTTAKPFPISNIGTCNLNITNVSIGGTNGGDFSLSGLPSFPIILQPGHIAGEGNLKDVFGPTAIDRDRLGTLTVTYESDPITHATTSVTRDLCGEGVLTGARVLVRAGGVPLANVEKIQLQRINANRNKNQLDTNDVVQNATLQTVTPGGACTPFQFHREYGTVGNPIQLLAGSYQVTATAIVNGKRQNKTVGFNVDTCDFNPTVIVDF